MNYIIIHLEVCEFPAKLQQVQWPQSTITLLCTPFFLFSAPIFSLLRTPFFLFSATLFLFSAPIVLFSAPFFLFSAPLIVVALLARMQSYSVNSLGVLECNHRLWVAIHVSRIQTSAWRLTGIMSLQFHVSRRQTSAWRLTGSMSLHMRSHVTSGCQGVESGTPIKEKGKRSYNLYSFLYLIDMGNIISYAASCSLQIGLWFSVCSNVTG